MKFRILNNWESLTFFLDKDQIDPTKVVWADVKWPDGTVERCLTDPYLKEGTYGDMGHTYSYQTRSFKVLVNYHGHIIHLTAEYLKDMIVGLVFKDE